LTIQASGTLLPTKVAIACGKRHKCRRCLIVQESVHLVSLERLGDQVGGLVRGLSQRRRLDLEQSLQRGQQSILSAVQAVLDGPRGDLGSRVELESLQDARDVVGDCTGGQDELPGNLSIR
jgi:hypothetical protein